METTAAPTVTITYCTQCNWLLRASWMAGELLQTFASEVEQVALRPGTGGIFTITATGPGAAAWVARTGDHPRSATQGGNVVEQAVDVHDGQESTATVWDRKADGGFPDIVDLKRRVRDVIAPDLVLGHADRAAAKAGQDS